MFRTVCISSSCKFEKDWQTLKEVLEKSGVKVFLPSDTSYADSVTEAESIEEKRGLMDEYNAFIDESDILNVYCPNGYIGVGVSIEIGYAYAKNKEIISSEEITEMGGRALTEKILSVTELRAFIEEEAECLKK